MTRATITVEKLIEAGYEPFEFSDYTMSQGVEDIRSGCEVRLEPRCGGYMVAVVIVKGYPHEMCTRVMTSAEKSRFAEQMANQEKRQKEFAAKVHARHNARMRQR